MTTTPKPHEATSTATKGLRVYILSAEHTNKVPFTALTLVGPGIPEIFSITPEAPGVEIVPHRAGPYFESVAVLVGGSSSPAAFLAKAGGAGSAPNWAMASGAYITTSDSRFPVQHPIALHNRYEV